MTLMFDIRRTLAKPLSALTQQEQNEIGKGRERRWGCLPCDNGRQSNRLAFPCQSHPRCADKMAPSPAVGPCTELIKVYTSTDYVCTAHSGWHVHWLRLRSTQLLTRALITSAHNGWHVHWWSLHSTQRLTRALMKSAQHTTVDTCIDEVCTEHNS